MKKNTITFMNVQVQHVVWTRSTPNGNPVYRITFNTESGAISEPIRNSWQYETAPNSGFAYSIIENRYNHGTPKLANITVREGARNVITDFEEVGQK